jgi:hypothetical protein
MGGWNFMIGFSNNFIPFLLNFPEIFNIKKRLKQNLRKIKFGLFSKVVLYKKIHLKFHQKNSFYVRF